MMTNQTSTRTHAHASVVNGAEVARAIGVTQPHVSMILNGKRTPTLPVAYRLAKHLGISIDVLYARIRTQQRSNPQADPQAA